MVERNEFFREVTLRLCSHLRIEDGLRECIGYLALHMPADKIYLERFDHELGVMRMVAAATARAGERLDKLVPLGSAAKTTMDHVKLALDRGMLPPVFVVNDPDDEPVSRELLAGLGDPLSSIMSIPLVVQDQPLGILALLAEGRGRFSDDHAELYALLREPFFVALSNMLEHQEVLRLKELLEDDKRYLQDELARAAGQEIIGADFGLRSVMDMVRRVATIDSPVLLLGETGVGKEVVANAVHWLSHRREGPFIKVNSGAIPDTLIDSELFGHEKGAFSGALGLKRGRFERAHTGTIFLDEIGELPPQAQVRMLRVLQEKEIERVGGTQPIAVDIRVIAATNRNLEEMVQAGTFREDLWFRLNVFPILVPPLRERREDIAALVVYFLERKARDMKLASVPALAPGSIETLAAYPWPGNVRELENLVERALILNPSGPIRFDQLISLPLGARLDAPAAASSENLNLDAVVSAHIRRVLQMTGGKVHGSGGAAEKLGVHPSTLRSRMKKLGIR